MLATIKPTATLPAIVAIYAVRDYGEYGNASCPHCGALGRYVSYFICEDGSRRGAMSGCINLFPGSQSRYSRLIQEAFNRQKKAEENKQRLASWWQEMIDAAERFAAEKLPDHDAIQAATLRLQQAIAAAEGRRQDWLNKNGYGKKGRRW